MRFTGVVQEGTKRATRLGYPTINIAAPHSTLSGIYAATVEVDGKTYHAAVFADEKRGLIEAHLLDVKLDLYGESATIVLLEKFRESEVFESDEALGSAIATDIANVRDYFSGRDI